MTLNLNKYGASNQEAWKEVRSEKSPINWALFGYEGTTFDLKLISKGEDGIEELKEDLNASKIMYAFLQVEDPKTSLPKYVFLHWQGESVPGTRKGLAATHLKDIERYFQGAHLTVNARDEDEVDEEEILQKVSKVSASAYNFKEKQTHNDAPPVPVGTIHKKINPKAELPSMDDREKFWNSEENKEKDRIAREKERKKSEAKQLESERRAREEKEAQAREAAIKERERKISQLKEKETKIEGQGKDNDKKKWEAQQMEDAKDEEMRQKRADELKRQRSEEAKQLIGQRKANEARAVFERNSSAGQMNFRRSSSQQQPPPPGQVSKPSIPEEVGQAASVPKEDAINANQVSTEDNIVPPPEFFGNDDNRVIAGKNEVPQLASPDQEPPQPPDVTGAGSNGHQPDLIHDVVAKQGPDVTASATRATDDEPSSDNENGANGSSEFGVCAMALYDYQAADETEISFDPGQMITHIDKIDPGWWQGLGPDGNYGLFPANYVELVDDPASARS